MKENQRINTAHFYNLCNIGTIVKSTHLGQNNSTVLLGKLFICVNSSVVQFKPINDGEGLSKLLSHILGNISGDQKYLYRIICVIRNGAVNENLDRQIHVSC